MRVLARSGIKIGLEDEVGVYKEPTQIVKLAENTQPQVEFDEVEIPNFGFYAGAKEIITIADWGRLSIDISTCMYKNIDFYSTLFAVCNLKATDDDTLGDNGAIIFTPWTHSEATASVDCILPDRKFKASGGKSSFSIEGSVGDKLTLNFGLQAGYLEEVKGDFESDIVGIDGGEALVIRRLGAMTINGVDVNLSEFKFDMGNTINYEKFTNVGEFHISDYDPRLTVKMRLEKGGESGFNEFKLGTTMSFEAIFKDAEQNDIFKLVIPKCKIAKTPEFTDQDGIYVIEREFIALSDKGDDNFQLIYYKQA